MGFFDSIKNAFGGDSNEGESVRGPSAVLRDAGIDPSDLDFQFGGDGSVTITGRVADAATRDRITETVSDIPQVSHVDNRVEIGPEPTLEPETTPEPAAPAETAPEASTPAEEPTAETAPEAPASAMEPPAESPSAVAPGQTYTVKSGDSLWKIAEAHYGDGSKYQAIFEANRDILDNPDLIKPGQELKLPEL